MILTRLGSKRRIAHLLIPHFPRHDIYIEPFFGTGSVYFAKPKAKYNFLNDADNEVYNLWKVVTEKPDELRAMMELMPIHETLWNEWKKEVPIDPVMKAVRFLFLSNFGYMGKPNTLHLQPSNEKPAILSSIDGALKELAFCKISCKDFRGLFPAIQFRNPDSEKPKAFTYNDPPYLGTDNNYEGSWTEADTADVFTVNMESGIRFAISEFDHPFVLEQAKHHGLNVIEIGERQNLKSRRTEILITNYPAVRHAKTYDPNRANAVQGNLFD
jgi:DNA adenine methylase